MTSIQRPQRAAMFSLREVLLSPRVNETRAPLVVSNYLMDSPDPVVGFPYIYCSTTQNVQCSSLSQANLRQTYFEKNIFLNNSIFLVFVAKLAKRKQILLVWFKMGRCPRYYTCRGD